MLIITRNDGESFYIGDDIKVKIIRSSNGNVTVGIEADKSIPILREEIREQYANNTEGNK